jgi:hypothetical protein
MFNGPACPQRQTKSGGLLDCDGAERLRYSDRYADATQRRDMRDPAPTALLEGDWQVVDFRFERTRGPGTARWTNGDRPVYNTRSWGYLVWSPALVVAFDREVDKMCFFIHESLVEVWNG